MSKVLCLSLAIVLLMVPVYGSADENGSGKQVSTTDQPAHSEKDGEKTDSLFLSEIVVSATKTNVPVSYSPVTTYTVDRNSIEKQPDYIRSNYGQLIQDVPGVFVGQATYKMAPWINLRGTGDFSARTLYLVDGLPVGSSTMLTNAVSNNDIERVDIVMGPSSALYGANASGGVVNIITRQGTKDTGVNLSYGYGSNNTNRPYVSIGNAVKKGDNVFNYYLSYSGDYSGGFQNAPLDNTMKLYRYGKTAYLKTTTVDDANYRNSYLAVKLGWLGASGANLTLAYNGSDSFVNGGQDNLIYVDDGHQGIGNLRFQLPIGHVMKLTLTGGYQYWDRPSVDNRGLSLTPGGLVLNTSKTYDNQSKVTRTPLELQSDFYIGANNILTAGAFYCNEKIKAARNNLQTGAFVSESEYPMDQTAFYLQDQAFFFNKKLSLLAGLRYDYWKYHDIYDSSANPTNPDNYHDNIINYRGGAKYQINDNFAIRSSAGTAYYPGLSTWFFQNITTGNTWREANPNLKPEKTWMVDLGLEGIFNTIGTSFGITAYYGKIKNMFSGRYDPHPTLPGVMIIRYSNVGVAEIYGVETQINQRITNHLSAFANITLNHSEIVKDPDNEGHQISHCPDYMANIGINYLNPGLFNGTLVFRAIDNMHYDTENIDVPYFAMDSYQTVDAKLWRDWKITDKVTLNTSISIENLLDKHYEQEFYYANPGRTVMAIIGIKYEL